MSEREANRVAFPSLAEMVDMVRAYHPGVRLVAGIEGDREVGKVDDEMRREYAQFQAPQVETETERLYREDAVQREQKRIRGK